MKKLGLWVWTCAIPLWAGEMPEKAANYHIALAKRPESAALFERFRDAWLEERSADDLEAELLSRAEAGEAGAWAILGRVRRAAGRDEAALEAFARAREQEPAAWLDLETARIRLAGRDFAAAEKDALAVPEGDARRPEALKLAGLACLRAERVDEALAHWAKAVEAAPGDKGLLEDLTELTRREGRFDMALEFCGKWRDAVEDAYGKAMAGLCRSELLLASQRFDEAGEELAAVLASSADGSWLERETIARAGQAFRQRGNATGWAAWIAARAEESPSRLNFRRAEADALAAAGRPDEALDGLAEVMKRSPGDVAARWQRIDLLARAMKLEQAYDECAKLADVEQSEAAGLRLTELAFRLENKHAVKRALDGVLAAADPERRVALAGLYARYGLPEESERAWRGAAAGQHASLALRHLAKHLQSAGRTSEALATWKLLGARNVAADRIEAARALSAAGEVDSARALLTEGRERFSAEPGYDAALAELAMMAGNAGEAAEIYLAVARQARRPDELEPPLKGWLRAVATDANPLAKLGDDSADRCLRAAWLAETGKPLPELRQGDELERAMRLALLREHGRWAEAVALMEAGAAARGPLFLSELAEAKSAAGDLAGALAAARAWRERAPEQPGPWLREAEALEQLGKSADAIVLLRRAAGRFEENEDVARRLFSLLQAGPNPREALDWAWKRQDRAVDEVVRGGWRREIVRVSKELGRLDDLRERFEERARRDPASPGPLVALAELAKARGDSRAELDFLRRAAVTAPQDVAVVSSLAALEERAGEQDRALERYAELARLVPGPDAARQLAQAKIRLGDIEGGMRDLQALAGENGVDLRALEQSAGDLASRGYLEEAARLLAAVDPARRDARLFFLLGMVLDADGNETLALDAFAEVMAEPDDPAEADARTAFGLDGFHRISLLLGQAKGSRSGRMQGVIPEVEIPNSLVAAKSQVRAQLVSIALQQGGEAWKRAVALVPELAVATLGQWREAMDFPSNDGSTWWEFVEAHPENPLGPELVVEAGQAYQATPEQVAALLKRDPPPSISARMQLRSGTSWMPDNLEFLESLDAAALQDPSVRGLGAKLIDRMFNMAARPEATVTVTVDECARGIAVLERIAAGGPDGWGISPLRACLALLKDQPDDFVRELNAMEAENAYRLASAQGSFTISLGHILRRWTDTAGPSAAEALVARIESPVLRCALNPDPGKRLAQVKRELAALPPDAPRETRGYLLRWKWSLQGPVGQPGDELREELEAAVEDDSDPRLAVEAMMRLRYGGNPSPERRARIQALLKRLEESPDEEDRKFAKVFGNFFGNGSPQRISRSPAGRWGAAMSFSNSSYGGGLKRNQLQAITAMDDREQAAREAARLLEADSRAARGRPGVLRAEVAALAEAGLLDAVLARISLPADAGLGRKVSMIALLDTAGKPDAAEGLLESIATERPWETRWPVDLALRSRDEAEVFRLLDGVAARSDFDSTLAGLLFAQDGVKPEEVIGRFSHLADWAARAQGNRAWIAPVLVTLANGGRLGISRLTEKNEPQLTCYRRYLKLALADPLLAEIAFRVCFSVGDTESPVDEAARQALLSGAYASVARGVTPPAVKAWCGAPDAPSALEYLVLLAAEHGDGAAFPAGFRERLEAADTECATWLGRLLAADSVATLPDIPNGDLGASNWPALARHEAGVLRAMVLPGRDAWLDGLFREKRFLSPSKNLDRVVCRSLLDADRENAMPDRAMALLEAAAGPRSKWKQGEPACASLQSASTLILNAMADCDPATFLKVLDVFREHEVPVSDTRSPFLKLALLWRAESGPPRNATLAELLGGKPGVALTLGVWQWSADFDGKTSRFIWCLPQVLRDARGARDEDFLKKVRESTGADLPDLIRAWTGTGDRILQRRMILKAAPLLADLRSGVRNGVIDAMTQGMSGTDAAGLPELVAARLRARLEGERKMRIEMARRNFQLMKETPSGLAGQGNEVGNLAGQLISDDVAFLDEVLAAWRPIAGADRSGAEMEAFTAGLVSSAKRDPHTALRVLRLLDSLWQGTPPSPRGSSDDLLRSLWSFDFNAMNDPEVWRQSAALSPKFRAKVWMNTSQRGPREFGADPDLVKFLRLAAKESEVTRAALEWCLETAASQRDAARLIDGKALLAFARALKEAGASVDDLAELLFRAYSSLPRMADPAAVMGETPALLEGLRQFPRDSAGGVFAGVQDLWQKIQREHGHSGGGEDSTPPALDHPAETAALLKFVMSLGGNRSGAYYSAYRLTPVVLATGDADLLGLWIRFAGRSLTGDLPLILELLERDRVADALALTPEFARGFTNPQPFGSRVERLVGKLSADPSPQAFALRARLSLLNDPTGGDAPAENFAARRLRIVAEFEKIREGMTVTDRAAMCEALYLAGAAADRHVPALDEFADGAAEREFRKMLGTGNQESVLARLFVPGVCSRANAGDLSGLARLADLVAAAPDGRAAELIRRHVIFPVQICLIEHANRHDAKPPAASVKIILTFAGGLAKRDGMDFKGVAAYLVCLASSDAASLADHMKRFGVVGVSPVFFPSNRVPSPANQCAMLRVALLHPCAAKPLADCAGEIHSRVDPWGGTILTLLREPALRARIDPAVFLEWTRLLGRIGPEDLEAVKLYASERRGDFDENQLTALDHLLYRFEKPRPRPDAEGIRTMLRDQEEMRRRRSLEIERRRGGR